MSNVIALEQKKREREKKRKKKIISDPFMYKLDKLRPGISPQYRKSTCNLTCHVSMEVE